MDKVKLAFVGCGGIVQGHLDHGLRNFEDVQFVGWFDINRDNALARWRAAGERGKVYTDLREMLDDAKPDALFISIPPFAHGEAEELAIERKIPFFIEKPIAKDLDVARRIADGVTKAGIITSVGYMNRYRKSVQKVKELLQGRVPVLLHGGWLGGPPQPLKGIWKWWVQKDKSGGQFLEQVTHTVDLCRYFFGEVEEVYAVAVKDRLPVPEVFTIEHASMVQMRFKNGAAGNLYASCSTPVGGGVFLNLWTTDMKAEFTGWEHSVKIFLQGQEPITIEGEPNIFAVEDRAFIDSVKAGRDMGIMSSYEDGLRTLAISCAANKSMETGEVVKVEV